MTAPCIDGGAAASADAAGDAVSSAVTYALCNGRTDAKRIRCFQLHVLTPGKPREVHAFAKPGLRVGSRPCNDLVIDDHAVSRIHFEVVADERGFTLVDLGSSNGTVVDGYRVGEIGLKQGSRIQVGRSEIAFEIVDAEREVPLAEQASFGPLLGRSAAMRELFAVLEHIAPSDVTVLVEGESGTGKEVVVQAIHGASDRGSEPLVVFDCAATPASLIESELFGHEKGAFTGASGPRAGCLEQADGGTLMFDEIGELPLDLQPKLLRVLENRQLRRIGGQQVRRANVRVVAATNRDLAAEVNNGSFREDLYYRLAVVRLKVPPLRERTEDIPLLVRHFAEQCGRDPHAVEAAIATLLGSSEGAPLHALPWRGNVRELRNVVERQMALGPLSPALSSIVVTGPRLPPPTQPAVASAPVDLSRPFSEQKSETIARFERQYLDALLAAHDGNISRAARAAGMERTQFKRLAKKYSR